jgi:hypothetical protein
MHKAKQLKLLTKQLALTKTKVIIAKDDVKQYTAWVRVYKKLIKELKGS